MNLTSNQISWSLIFAPMIDGSIWKQEAVHYYQLPDTEVHFTVSLIIGISSIGFSFAHVTRAGEAQGSEQRVQNGFPQNHDKLTRV